jgi:hypothetical protein
MSVLVLACLLGCDDAEREAELAPPPPAPAEIRAAPAAAGAPRAVEIVLEPGQLADDGWVGVSGGADRLVFPDAHIEEKGQPGARRWRAALPPGPGVARVARGGCGTVEVPYTVGPVPLVVLPYPACSAPDAPALPTGARLERRELPASLVEIVRELELFPDVPAPALGEEDGPARWLTLDEARAICAWRGGRLPTYEEWAAARVGAVGAPVGDATRGALGSAPVGAAARALARLPTPTTPAGHEDLDGNVEEWLADGRVAGGSWASLPGELGVARSVPPNARTDTIGARCAYDP